MNHHNHLVHHRRTLARYHPSAWLLAVQLLSLVLYAVLDGSAGHSALLSALGVLALPLVVWVIHRSRTVRWIAWALGIPAFLLSLLCVFTADPILRAVSALLEAILYFYAAGSLIAYMMEDLRVTVDELFAAGATFTLLAWGFAHAYISCQAWVPGSFISSIDPEPSRTFLQLLSLSFTNLTATGLGDIVPVTPPARVLVMLEQFAGIGYVAVVVSRLIGMTLASQKNRRTP